MSRLHKNLFTTVKTEGSILPADLLQRVADNDPSVPGLKPEDYHLDKNEKINEGINRSWNCLISSWSSFKNAREKLPEKDMGTTITRNFVQVLFRELGYGRLFVSKPFLIEEKTYPVSHIWHRSPIHIVGFRVDIDKRTPGVKGASTASPHSMVQEFLNRSDDHLWAFVSNGFRLRILRDNITLTRQAYVEFDLESIMDGEIYSDFTLLWLVCHESRVEADKPEQCWLEKWFRFSADEGVRALDGLRGGVEKAISSLGAGFISYPANRELKEKLRSGLLSTQDYYRQLLRLVYRLIFLFVAEDRQLLLDPSAPEDAKERYIKHYSTQRIRRIAERVRGTRHIDLYRGLKLVMDKLSSDSGCPELALPPLGSFLWTDKAIPDIFQCDISNRDFLSAIRPLSYTINGKVKRIVDYKNMGAEELGSVYESLLELHPEINADGGDFILRTSAGNERKTTGSYYTPTSLINCLLDSALDPVLDEAVKNKNPENAILNLKICDPACGSGHFLIAGAHRIAKKLAYIRTGDEEPSPDAVRHALRDVIGRCIYGVDINPMAVELCKVSLWMSALEPGKPLSFLEHHIKCGNSLIGTTPALIEKGIPDSAFEPIKGEDQQYARCYRKQNQREKIRDVEVLEYIGHKTGKQGETRKKKVKIKNEDIFDHSCNIFKSWEILENLSTEMIKIGEVRDDHIAGIRKIEKMYEENIRSPKYTFNKFIADAWCASFLWQKKKTENLPYPITEAIFREIKYRPDSYPESHWMNKEIVRLAEQYQVFHWHIEFPDVFHPFPPPLIEKELDKSSSGWAGGFDVVLGNPPWERIKLQEKEWFALRCPDIASAPNASARKKMIEDLKHKDPSLHYAFTEDLRKAEGESFIIRNSGKYPLCGRGDVNTYTIFAELNRNLINGKGRVGCIVPSGIATDDTTKFFFQDLIKTETLSSLYDFENREKIFPAVDSRMKFCLLTLSGIGKKSGKKGAEFVFFAHNIEDLKDDNKVFTLSAEDIELLNPNTKTCPIFRSKKDAELTKAIYRRVPVLIKEHYDFNGKVIGEENPWGISFLRMFDMANDSYLFRTREQLESEGWKLEGNIFKKEDKKYLPLYEAKMIHHFDHRWATYRNNETGDSTIDEKQTPFFVAIPRYWLHESDLSDCISKKWQKKWLIGFRNITNVTNERTIISSIINIVPVGNSSPVIFLSNESGFWALLLISVFSSYIVDYSARQKLGGTNLTYGYFNQFPVFSPSKYNNNILFLNTKIDNWLLPRVLELVYTAWDLEDFAKDCGYDCPPFKWDEERRFLIRCELDACYFHLYEIERDDVEYIMETFPIVRRKDEDKYDSFYGGIPFVKECCERYTNPITKEKGTKYATKSVIMDIYDRMTESMKSGIPYQTVLNPPPGDLTCTHPGR